MSKKLQLYTKNNLILKFYIFLKKLGIKNPGNIYSWIKYHCLRWFIDWFFSENYYYISNERYVKMKDFKQYFNDWNKYERLVKNLNFDSINLINRYFNVINAILSNRDLCLPSEILSISNNPKSSKILKNIKEYVKDFYLPKNEDLLPEVWFYKHWIYHIPNIIEYTKWKDVIDCWASIWDSALMLEKELSINKIFCCEPDSKNYEILKKIIQNNNKKSKIIPLNDWVWSKKCKLKFDWWKQWISKISNDWWMTVNINTIDNLVNDYWINPWLIKRDIEWAEYDSLLWAEQTIKRYKPDLLISIYHTAKDFFEIKPLIESWNLWYKFKIVHNQEQTSDIEITLLAYIV